MLYLSLILYIITFIGINKISYQMFQQNKYNANNNYLVWLKRNINEAFSLETCTYIVVIIFAIIGYFNIALYLFLMLCIYNIIKINELNVNSKLPLKFTPRVKRIITTEVIINIIILILIVLSDNAFLYVLVYMSIKLIFHYPLVMVPNFINKPLEKVISNSYRKKAKSKLERLSTMKVIGITGSYGKTSSKNILNDILNVKYNTVPTPLNYNTPSGLTITINNHLNKYVDYFIAEMGACRVNDIKELCDLVNPKYGILTNVGVAHLESFGSEENIQKTKFELIESLPIDGLGILNKDDKNQLNYKLKNKVLIKYIAIDNKTADAYAHNIKIDKEGSSFEVYFKDEDKSYKFKTKLLGKANIYNLLAGILLGKYLGIEMHKLIVAVRNVKPVEHRLSLKPYLKDIYLIDDAYNSNPLGASMALDVIKLMNGTRVIVTPGMIELGDKDKELHYEFGKQMANSVDYAILIGKNKTKDIYRGLIENKFSKDKIYILNDVQEGFELLTKLKEKEKKLYALIENDLPDSFKEGKNK